MINKLTEKIKKLNAPVVVGLDPMLNYVPEHIQKKAFDEFGETLEGAAEAIWQFNKEIIDKTYDLIPAVKPQIAMYEQFGIPGLAAFKKTVDYAKSKDIVVIGDNRRDLQHLKRPSIMQSQKILLSLVILREVTSVLHLQLMPSDMSEKYRWEAKPTFLSMRTL